MERVRRGRGLAFAFAFAFAFAVAVAIAIAIVIVIVIVVAVAVDRAFASALLISRSPSAAAEWTRGTQCRGRVGRGVFLWATFLCTSKEELFNSRMAGQGGSRPEGERKPLILLLLAVASPDRKKRKIRASGPKR